MANYYIIWIKFHWGFSYVTHYMKHFLLSTRRVISSIITRNFVTRNKQPMTIGSNRMCVSRDDNWANTMCFPRQLPTTADTSCPIGKLPVIKDVNKVSYLLVSYFVMNFLAEHTRKLWRFPFDKVILKLVILLNITQVSFYWIFPCDG